MANEKEIHNIFNMKGKNRRSKERVIVTIVFILEKISED